MDDCISRQAAINAFEPEHDTDWYTPQIIEVLEALPPVQPTQTNADSTQSNTLDCVSRRAAMIVIENSGLDDDSKDTVVRVLEQLPSAQPQRKKGKWIRKISVVDCATFVGDECSQCGYFKSMGQANFCPNCGADMRGDSNE